MKRLIGLAAVAALALSGCGGDGGRGDTFPDALESCKEADSSLAWRGFALGDDGRTLTIDGAGADGVGATLYETSCLLVFLDAPDRVLSAMESTRALDGRQSDTWNFINASWSYHPDNGLDIILSLDD